MIRYPAGEDHALIRRVSDHGLLQSLQLRSIASNRPSERPVGINQVLQDPREQVKAMYRIALSREPTPREVETNVAFLNKQRQAAAPNASIDDERARLSALTDLAHVTLNLNEFLYIE